MIEIKNSKQWFYSILTFFIAYFFLSFNVLAYDNQDSIYVDIKGEVKRPGVYEVNKNMIVNQVIEKAGGLTENADTEYLNLSKKVTDEMVIIVYSKKEIKIVKKSQNQKKKKQINTSINEEKVVTEEVNEDLEVVNDSVEANEEEPIKENGDDNLEITKENNEENEVPKEWEENLKEKENIIEEKKEPEEEIKKEENVETEEIEVKKEDVKEENVNSLKEVEGKSKGIDVSKYQGNIDFEKVKKGGIDFVMIRVGYRGTVTGEIKEDVNFEKNIKGAIQAGLKVGVYFFSVATTKKEALEEAKFTVSKIKKYNITYPVAFDFETFKDRAKKLTNKRRTDYALTFLEYVEKQGYEGMFYSYKAAFLSKFQMERLKDYKIWLAHYTNDTDYQGEYEMWQYTSNGKINGIKGRVDLNVAYFKYV